MSKFEDRSGNTMGVGLFSAISHTFSRVLLAAWNVAVVAVIIVPAASVPSMAARTIRWLEPRKDGQRHRPLVIEGEFEASHSGRGKG